ncbi:hypothetical protein BKA07_002046 [Brevibacterium marinum]|uniref:Uncharacterized protein n=1 Tax=Brevibacterium marinum TaxID=418643 RepID=A0A846S4J7_9MICO|nr:hypothetical protein [Brevibacterium marinum]
MSVRNGFYVPSKYIGEVHSNSEYTWHPGYSLPAWWCLVATQA